MTEGTLFTSQYSYNITVHARDYADEVYLELNGLQHGKTPFIDGFTVSVSIDDENNVYIRSNDENWLEAACKAEQWNSEGEKIEKGSFLYFADTETGRENVFHNTQFPEEIYREYELKTDDLSGEKYIYISGELLGERLTEGKKYSFRFNTYGYPMYWTDEDSEGGFIIFSALKEPSSEVSVWYGNDGLNIESGDTDFLDALASEFVFENENEVTSGGYIAIICDDGSEYHIRNSRYLNDGEENVFNYYESQYGSIFIECNTLLIYGVSNSESATAVLHASGYSPVTVGGIELTEVMNVDDPGNVTVTVEENGDLIIDSENKNWLRALCEEYLHAATPFSPGGCMTLISADDIGYKIYNTEEISYYYEDGVVIFPAEKQIERLTKGVNGLGGVDEIVAEIAGKDAGVEIFAAACHVIASRLVEQGVAYI